MKNIKLSISSTINGLSNEQLGIDIYNEQIQPYLDKNKIVPINIIFPKNIERISTSFFNGLISTLLKKYGFYNINENIQIVIKNKHYKIDDFVIC